MLQRCKRYGSRYCLRPTSSRAHKLNSNNQDPTSFVSELRHYFEQLRQVSERRAKNVHIKGFPIVKSVFVRYGVVKNKCPMMDYFWCTVARIKYSTFVLSTEMLIFLFNQLKPAYSLEHMLNETDRPKVTCTETLAALRNHVLDVTYCVCY